MNSSHRCGSLWSVIALLGVCCAGRALAFAQYRLTDARHENAECPRNDSGLTLPAGFCATVFADGIGHARHLAVAANGVVYVNTWSGRYYGNDSLYAELNDKILAFKLGKASVVPAETARIVVSGLPLGGDHPMHPFAIDA